MGNWPRTTDRMRKATKLLGGHILGLVTRLVKWSFSEHMVPSGRFPIHSLRVGGGTCMYRPGADLEYFRRFGHWASSKFAIYRHFGGEILRGLSSCLMGREGLTSQLKLRTDDPQEISFDKKGRSDRCGKTH